MELSMISIVKVIGAEILRDSKKNINDLNARGHNI
jgi:hypothetical protein